MNEFFDSNEGPVIQSLDMPSVMKKTFLWLFAGIILSAISALVVVNNESLISALYGSMVPLLILSLAELGLVIILSRALTGLSYPMAIVGYVAYALVNGVTLSYVFLAYELGSVVNVFFMTAGVFGLMAVIGYTTKVDLTKIGNICMIALFGIILASIINILIGSSGLNLIITVIGIVIFTGLTAYDIQKIKAYSNDPTISAYENLPILCALTIYLDFINLFIRLLQIFGKRRN